ncbi:MAG: hypothetical protein ACUVQY_01490 [Thermoproteota archaeon]
MMHRSSAITTLHTTMTYAAGRESYELFRTKGTLIMKWLYHSSRTPEPAMIRLHRNSCEVQDLSLSSSWNPLYELRENWQCLRELEHFCKSIFKDEEPYCRGKMGGQL